MANGRHNAAFTLLELVVVIAIVVVLIGLLSVGLIGARQKAARRATQGRMAQLELAIEMYYNDYRTYPPDTCLAGQAIECLVDALTVVRPYIQLKKLERHDADADGYYEVWDAWGNPLHYVVPDSGTITSWGANSLTDSSKTWDNDQWNNGYVKVGSQIRRVTDTTAMTLTLNPTPPWSPNPSVGDGFTVYFGNSGFVDIWSNGPDRVSNTDDDVTNWERH